MCQVERFDTRSAACCALERQSNNSYGTDLALDKASERATNAGVDDGEAMWKWYLVLSTANTCRVFLIPFSQMRRSKPVKLISLQDCLSVNLEDDYILRYGIKARVFTLFATKIAPGYCTLCRFDTCFDAAMSRPETVTLVLRKWCNLNPSMLFRCFVRGRRLAGGYNLSGSTSQALSGHVARKLPQHPRGYLSKYLVTGRQSGWGFWTVTR